MPGRRHGALGYACAKARAEADGCGGGVLGSVACSNLPTGIQSAYALGWDPAAQVGSSCGVANCVATSPPQPQSMAQVYNFLQVTVTGNTVTVTPTNAAGQTFDVQTDHAARPQVAEITPSAGPTGGGTTVTVYGSNLLGATAVNFGVNASPQITVHNADSVSAVVPAGSAGQVDVTVSSSDGTSAPTPADLFTYTATAGPVVANVLPHSGAVNGGTTLTVSGMDSRARGSRPRTCTLARLISRPLVRPRLASPC